MHLRLLDTTSRLKNPKFWPCKYLCMFMRVFIHTYTDTHTHTHTFLRSYAHIYTSTHTHTHIPTYMRTYIHKFTHTHTHKHTHTHFPTYMRTHMHRALIVSISAFMAHALMHPSDRSQKNRQNTHVQGSCVSTVVVSAHAVLHKTEFVPTCIH